MKRYDHWPKTLHDYVQLKAGHPFAWSVNDCCNFVCDGILAMTGTDLGTEFRGKYSSLASAFVTIKDVTGATTLAGLAEYFAAKESLKEWPNVLFAQRGDVVLFNGSEGEALGLVYLNGIHAVFVGQEGLRRIPIAQCKRAWKIG